jgi:hypothetical protein
MLCLKSLNSMILETITTMGRSRITGRIELYDNNNEYYYGKVKSKGRFEFYDANNNYYYGKVKPGGNLEVYTPDGRILVRKDQTITSRFVCH